MEAVTYFFIESTGGRQMRSVVFFRTTLENTSVVLTVALQAFAQKIPRLNHYTSTLINRSILDGSYISTKRDVK